jgi:hypothetical protein
MKYLLARKPWMLGHIELTELLVTELPDDAESGGCRSNDQRHGEMVQTSGRKPGDPGERPLHDRPGSYFLAAQLGLTRWPYASPAAHLRQVEIDKRHVGGVRVDINNICEPQFGQWA